MKNGKVEILVINPGSTSTKVAYYQEDVCIVKENLVHQAALLSAYHSIWEQIDLRREVIEEFLKRNNILKEALDAVVTRGGHTRPLSGGIYYINEVMLAESASEKFGNHACDLGLILAKRFEQYGAKPLTAYTPVTDEFEPLARYSGLPEIRRRSCFHALNHKGAAHYHAGQVGKRYEDMNLVVAHMGGGISVAAHRHGQMVDANNALTGDGPFSTNRSGGLPIGDLIEACFSGNCTQAEMMRRVNGTGGMMAYVGDNDLLTVEQRANAGESVCAEVIEAMGYQTAKEIGAYAAVLDGTVDAILLTGGMANSEKLTGFITEKVRFIAPVVKYPGEFEMRALAQSALSVLDGTQTPRVIE